MRTRTSISTISYNTIPFLKDLLNDLINQGKIAFYAFIYHLKEDDEKKDHIHIFIVPGTQLDTFSLEQLFKEVDPNNDLPLSCIPFVHSKFEDFYLYALHDKEYLCLKGLVRKYHYNKSDFIVSNDTYFQQLIQQGDFSKTKLQKQFHEYAKKHIPFKYIVAEGIIPFNQVALYQSAYNNLLDYYYSLYDDADGVEDGASSGPNQ